MSSKPKWQPDEPIHRLWLENEARLQALQMPYQLVASGALKDILTHDYQAFERKIGPHVTMTIFQTLQRVEVERSAYDRFIHLYMDAFTPAMQAFMKQVFQKDDKAK